MGGLWLGGSVRVMVRSLVLNVALTLAVVGSMVLSVGVSASSDGPVTVAGEYVDYMRFEEHHVLGPFPDLQAVFHPGGVGPVGVPCTADTVTVVQNEVVFTFDPDDGSVTGTGLLELSCEFHPGCGAVTRVMEANYSGEYDAEKRLMTGTVDYWSSGGEQTSWGTKGGANPVDQCLELGYIQEGEAWTQNWVLNVAEENPIGYNAHAFEGGDPAQRYGFFTVPPLLTANQADTGASAGGDGESVVESAADSGDESSSASGETTALVAGDSQSVGMKALIIILVMAGSIGFLAAIRHVIRLRMGFKE